MLYNLYLKYDKRGFKTYDVELFLRDNWNVLQCGNVSQLVAHSSEDGKLETSENLNLRNTT